VESIRVLVAAPRKELLALIARQQAILAAQQARLVEQAAMIAEQQGQIASLQQRLSELEGGGGTGVAKGMPGLKPKSAKATRPKAPHKQRSHHFVRRRSRPTERVAHKVKMCPDCGARLMGGWVKRRREVIEVTLTPVQVVEHQYWERQCPLCRKRWTPRVELGGQALGKKRLGVGLLSLIATLREEARLPFATIQWYLESFHQLHLGVGTLVGVVQAVAQRGQETVQGVRERIRASPVVHADETGWREDGHNGYAWTFSTPTERYFLHGRRDKGMVDAVLGDEFSGVLVSDFYAAYHHYPGEHQRCWTHLLGDIHDLKEQHLKDKSLWRWAAQVRGLYTQAKAFRSDDPRQRLRARRRFERSLLAVCEPFCGDPGAAQRVLCQRVQRHLRELFVFVSNPKVPPDNNAAERSLRHLVTGRKISGGTRSPRGTDTKMKLSTLFGTWRVQGLNPFLACRQLLISPQP
jgi:transposase